MEENLRGSGFRLPPPGPDKVKSGRLFGTRHPEARGKGVTMHFDLEIPCRYPDVWYQYLGTVVYERELK